MRVHARWIAALMLSLMACTAQAQEQASSGWQPVNDTIRKSEQDPRHYQAIRLDNGMTVLLVSDPVAPKSLAALTLPIGSLDDPDQQAGLAHYLEHMVLMGSKHYPQPDNLAEFLKNMAAATTPAQPLTAPPFIWKWKMTRWNRRLIAWRMRWLSRCWIRLTLTASATP